MHAHLLTGQLQDIDHSRLALTEEARLYLEAGSPEAQVFHAIPEAGITLTDLKVAVEWRSRGTGVTLSRLFPTTRGVDMGVLLFS